MRILQIAIQPSGGGAEKVARLLHLEFRKSNECALVYMNASVSELVPNSFSLDLPKSRISRYGKGLFRLRQFARNFNPDVTLIHCEEPQILSAITPRLGKMFYIEHQPLLFKGYRRVVMEFVHFLLKLRKSKVIHLRQSRKVNELSLATSNPIEDLPKTFKRWNSSNWNNEFKLVYIGRLSTEKGFGRIPDIVRGANEASIEVFGSGPLRSKTEFRNLDVYYKGFVNDVWEKIPNSTLLLIPSLWEGDGLVIVEALCLQVPFLISNFDGLDELPVPKSSVCSNNVEMSEKIVKLRKGFLVPDELININARQELMRSRNLQRISSWYLNTFKESIDAR